MGARDVIKHIKDALASAHPGAVDDEVTEYVADMASELLADGDPGRCRREMADELVDAAGPMLAEFIGDDAIRSYLTERWRTTSGEEATARVQTRRGGRRADRSRPRSDTASTSKDHPRVRGKGQFR